MLTFAIVLTYVTSIAFAVMATVLYLAQRDRKGG